MDQSNQGSGDRKLFGMFRGARKPRTKASQKSQAVIPGIAESVPAVSAPPPSSSSPPASHAPEVVETRAVAPHASETTDIREEESSPSSSNVPVPGLAATSSTCIDWPRSRR